MKDSEKLHSLKEEETQDEDFGAGDVVDDWTDGIITYTDDPNTPSFTFRVFLLGLWVLI